MANAENMKTNFDLIVIGAGSGGLNIASFMNRVGLRVLLIDKRDETIGGDCLNFGCVPSKALIHAARTVHAAHQASDYGLTVSGAVDWPAVRASIKHKQDIIREHENAAWFRRLGMTVVFGDASFTGPNEVFVNGETYCASKIVLATGSRPRELKEKGIEQVATVLNNENIFTLEQLPTRLLVLGGGPIGIEIAQALARLGVTITVAERGAQILGKEDADIAGVLKQQLAVDGITFRMGYALKEFTGPHQAVLEDETGQTLTEDFDAVFVSIGRVLNVAGLQLEAAGIKQHENGSLVVDAYLRTTNKNIFVCGDVAGNYQFTHAAEMHAATIIKNFFTPFKKAFSADTISWVTYTTPEVATFGLQPAELQRRGQRFEILETNFNEDDRAITDDYQNSRMKLYVDPKGRLLGGTMVAPHAGELIQELVLLQTLQLPLTKLFSKTYAYPNATRVNKRAASGYMTRKLTPLTRGILRWLYRR